MIRSAPSPTRRLPWLLLVALLLALASTAHAQDSDGDGVDDASDPAPLDPAICGDGDIDSCDDCSAGHAGVVLYDTRMFYPTVHSGRRDDDWSMRNGIANDAGDWIDDETIVPLVGAGDELWSRNSGAIWPHSADAAFCRRESDLSVCPDGDAEACDHTLDYASPDLWICHDESEDEYVTLPIRSMSGCAPGTAAGASSVFGGPKFVPAPGDSCQQAWPDGIHREAYMSRLVAQGLLDLRWEAAFFPERNLVDDGAGNTGDMEGPDCRGVFPSASNAAVNPSPSEYDPQSLAPGARSAIHGSACRMRTLAGGGSVATGPLNVEPDTWHTCHFYVSSSNASDAIELQVYDDGAPAAPLPQQTTWHYLENGPLEMPGGLAAPGQAWNWIYAVQKFHSGPETSVRWRLATGAATLLVDDLFCYPSVHQNAGLNPVLESGEIDVMIAGDSRTFGIPSRLPAAIDERLSAGVRPDLSLSRPAQSSRIEMLRLDQTHRLGEIAARGPDYAILNAAINDFATDGIETLVSEWTSALALIPGPTVPIWIGEGAYRGNTTATDCGGGTRNCATLGQELVHRLITAGAFNSEKKDGVDSDADDICDAGDDDDDGDGVPDVNDPERLERYVCGDSDEDGCDDCAVLGSFDPQNDGADYDSDGICDVTDPEGDMDADGVPDSVDLCPSIPDPTNADTNGDGVGDACDTECSNGIDDDGDGLADLDDPGCANLRWVTESPACSDGLDNDGDGGIDSDGSPPDAFCSEPWLLREAPRACGLGFELALLLPGLAALRRSRRRA